VQVPFGRLEVELAAAGHDPNLRFAEKLQRGAQLAVVPT
jgi:hypothetical protein